MSDIMKRDTASLDIPLLRALRALVNESSVTQAAHVLGIGQPAMSGQLARLRAIFGDPLLTRSGGGSKPTLRALELAASVDEILARIDLLAAARHTPLAPSQWNLSITIAATDYARQWFLEEALPRIRQEAPGLHLRFHRSDRDRVREWMEEGTVDIGIGAATVPTGRLHSRRLYRDGAVCVAARGLMPQPLTIDAYCALPHLQVRFGRASEIESLIDARLDVLGRTRLVVLTVPDFSGVVEIVRGAALVAVVPRGFLKRLALPKDIDVRDPPFALPDVQCTLYWHDRTNHSVPHKWLRGVIVEAFKGFSP